jgi:hypothetical protein
MFGYRHERKLKTLKFNLHLIKIKNDYVIKKLRPLTFFASLAHEIRRALAHVRPEEGEALSSVLTLGLSATPTFQSGHASDDFHVLGIVAGWAQVPSDPSRILGVSDEVVEGVAVDDEPLDGAVEALHDPGVLVQRVREPATATDYGDSSGRKFNLILRQNEDGIRLTRNFMLDFEPLYL